MTLWKILGLAGVVGVAATGALVVKNERTRRSYEPDEVRARLHERFARAAATANPSDAASTPVGRPKRRFSRGQ